MPHTGGRRGRDGQPHEQVRYETYIKLRGILDQSHDEDDLEELHRQDLDTTWFGTMTSLPTRRFAHGS
jgi:hypothetical protein